jgi:protein-histidine pros-kinase
MDNEQRNKLYYSVEALEQIYLKALEASADAIVVIADDGQIVVFNAQAEFLFGYARSEVIGEKIEILIPDDVKKRHPLLRDGYMNEPRVREMGSGLPLRGRHRKGHTFPVEVKLSAMTIPKFGLHAQAVIRRTGDNQLPSQIAVSCPVIVEKPSGE